jgi:dinuclear metal center YbgI/SA1388 family protein
MKLSSIISLLESKAPLSSQESYDNSGLIVGDRQMEVNGALLSLDCTEEIVDEAIALGVNLIIAHHPIVFKGLKQLNGKNYVERTVIKAIKNDIAIYAIHTNLDNYNRGVNYEIGNRLGLKNLQILAPKKGELVKIMVFTPLDALDKVAQAMFAAGAGSIGDYKECSFETQGVGAFLPTGSAEPAIGKLGEREEVEEKKLELLCSSHQLSKVIAAMKSAHPYEEVAHDIIPLLNQNQDEGAGMIGELDEEMDVVTYLSNVKKAFQCGAIKYTKTTKRKVKKIAFCGGSGAFLIHKAKAKGADLYITGDVKYHEFFDGEKDMVIADIGHYESEQFTPNLIHAILTKNFTTFAVHLSEVNTNPINYLY